ncbi:MAG: hypothetical protein OXH41_03695 [Chloroflexi bacterium]|nr:hypothetical protein [Chloroflexota bacterium]
MAERGTTEEAAKNLARFLSQRSTADQRAVILSRLWQYMLTTEHADLRSAYGLALDSASEETLRLALRMDIERVDALYGLERRVENLEALLGEIINRLDRLEDS